MAEDLSVNGAVSLEDRRFDPRDLWRVLVKKRQVILGVLLTSVIATTVLVFTMSPRYTATATILIERQAPKIAPVQEIQQVDAVGSTRDDYYETQFQLLQSRSLAARVIKALALHSDERFVGRSQGLLASIPGQLEALFRSREDGDRVASDVLDMNPQLINQYLGMLSITPVTDSRLVKVSFTSESKELSAELANKHAEEFISASLDLRRSVALRAESFLEAELAKAKDRVVRAELKLNDYRRDKGIIGVDGEKSDIVSQRLVELNQRFTEAQSERIRLEADYRLVQSRSPESLPSVTSSPLIQQLKQEASRVEAERAQLEEKFLPGYPALAEAAAREKQVKSRLNSEIHKIVQAIESSFLSAEHREEELAKQLEAQRQATLEQKDVGADYATLNRDVDTARSLYANLLQRLKDVDVSGKVDLTNISIVDPATLPLVRSSPRRGLDLALASVLGLALGVALAFLLETLDNTVKTSDDIERRFGLPVLGVVPSFGSVRPAYGALASGDGKGSSSRLMLEGDGDSWSQAASTQSAGSRELVLSKRPTSVMAEAYRAIRTGILLSSADAAPQVILFTSGGASEGKTVTATNQALALAQSGARVLLIDADIRKPRLHDIFDVLNGAGLSTYLTGQSSLEAVIREVSLALSPLANGKSNGSSANGAESLGSIHLIPSGPTPPNPAELLGSRRMRETVELLRQRFDYIIIDSPPILPVTDAVVLSAMTDGVVLVVRAEHTAVETVAKAHARLRHVRAKIIGTVLNDVDVRAGEYGEYHGYYGSYGDRGVDNDTALPV
jgi:succinoglycan biosynthesis transport protein ExoP